jgi:mRNA interferase RelE/StbE
MKCWNVEYLKEAEKDIDALNASAINQVLQAIDKVSQNPLPKSEGGYGKPLGNKGGRNLTGLCKIKLLKLGIRIIYKLVRTHETMKIIVVAARSDNEVYKLAEKRYNNL